MRYQKQLYSNSSKSANSSDYSIDSIESKDILNETYQYNGEEVKKGRVVNFFKNRYKEIIAVVLGFIIGGFIGSTGKVSTALSDEVTANIAENRKTIEIKQGQLETLQEKKIELEGMLNN